MSSVESAEETIRKLLEENESLKQQVARLLSAQEAPSIFFPHEHENKMQQRINSISEAGIVKADVEETAFERNKVVVRVPATSANLGPGLQIIFLRYFS